VGVAGQGREDWWVFVLPSYLNQNLIGLQGCS
jgi:hypothetical protein